MRLIDADDLIEHAWRDKLDSRELIAQMIENAPTVKTEKTPKEIEQQIHEFAEKMYQAGYADGNNTNLIDEAYQEGLNDAWECAKKLVLMPYDSGFDNKTVKGIFGTTHCYSIFENMPVSTVVAKIKDYEKQQKQADTEIRVGDEVIVKGYRAIVIKVDIDYWYRVVYENGNTDYIHQDTITGKTGKHYSQIAEVLKELKEDENNADSN